MPERIGSFWWRSGRDPDAHRQDRWSLFVVLGTVVAGWGLSFGVATNWTLAAVPWFRPQLTIAGIVVVLLGISIHWWAIISLGRYFTLDVAVRTSQSVVESGPDRFVRHPAYSGVLLICIGVGLAMVNWAAFVAIVIVLPIGIIYRMRVEERVICDALGSTYAAYMHRTKRFIPFLL